MSHGNPLILKISNIDENLRSILLDHPYFSNTSSFELQDNFIKENPNSKFDQAVIEFLSKENYDYRDMLIEYWFQSHPNNICNGLPPHCDYNFVYREKMKLEGDDWPHKVDKSLIVSPITIIVYLELSNDLIGGELGISSQTWYNEATPVAQSTLNNIKNYPYFLHTPIQDQVLYFKGSENYHWIEPLHAGIRKSMLINFWPVDLDIFRKSYFEQQND